ncbi:MAG TPA: SBBP repeat-containing protein, partial [Blastocatellia bacterium]|nr:SBBP repeat-containing protein [Blastocatellia bacterium]
MNRSRSYPALVAILLAMGLTKLSASPVSFSHAIDTGATAGESSIAGGSSTTLDKDARRRIEGVYGKLPLSFEMNQGQFDAKVRFISRGDGYNLLLTSTEVVFHLSAGAPASSKRRPGIRRPTSTVLKMKMLGANRSPQVEGQVRMRGTSNYFIGAESSRWRTGVPSYERVLYREIYPGIDMVYYGNRRELEYDFHIAPGASPDVIEMGFTGARRVRINKEGGLDIGTVAGDVRIRKPFIYQENAGSRQEVKGGYIISGKNRVGFKVSSYDKDKPLIIDPVFSYSTFLGGTSFEEGKGIIIDSQGNAYVTGRTTSFNFPIDIDSYDTTLNGFLDVFVTKLDATGADLIYSTYIGGDGEDLGQAISLDPSGNVYVTGATNSVNYPTTPGAFRTTFGGSCCPGDAFVTKLNATGTDLVYSTYLGGFSSDQGNAIALDSFNNAYVTGFTNSPNFPITPGAFQTTILGGGQSDAFISKLNATGTALVYSTFLGGTNSEQGNAIKVDASGNAYVAGATSSSDFDVTPGAFQTIFGGGGDSFSDIGDAFVTKLNATGTALIYSTYVGGAKDDTATGLALSSSGEAYITGFTTSANFPTTPGVLKVLKEGVARTSDSGSSWSASNSGLTDFNVRAFAIDPS